MADRHSTASELRQSFDDLTIALGALQAFFQAVDEASDSPPAWLTASQALLRPALDAVDRQDALFVQRVLPALAQEDLS